MKAATAALIVSALLIGSFGCRGREDELVVTVVMVAKGAAFNARIADHRLTIFSASRPLTTSGRPIVVQEVFPSRDQFAHFVATNPSVDIIIGDSPQQLNEIPALQKLAGKPANVCGDTAYCPAVIAPWVRPDKLESVQRVYALIIGTGPQ